MALPPSSGSFMKTVHIKHAGPQPAPDGKLAKPRGCASYHATIPASRRGFRGPLTCHWAPAIPMPAPAATSQRNDPKMLDALRRGATGWMAKLLFALLVLSFAIWGVADVFRGLGPRRARQGRQPRDPSRGVSARLPERDQSPSRSRPAAASRRSRPRRWASTARPRPAHRHGRPSTARQRARVRAVGRVARRIDASTIRHSRAPTASSRGRVREHSATRSASASAASCRCAAAMSCASSSPSR